MNVHRFSENILAQVSFDAILANSTQNGSWIDTLGYRRAAIVINGWTGAATTLNFTVSDSPDSSTPTVVAGATLGAAIVANTPTTATPVAVVNVDLAKRQRYLRVNIVGTGAAGNASALVYLFEGQYQAPAQATNTFNV